MLVFCFPFFIQIETHQFSSAEFSQSLWDTQWKALSLKRTGIAITLDIGEQEDIHQAKKQDVSLRLARLALHYDYCQNEIVPTGPIYKSQTIHSDYIDLSFEHIVSG